MGEEYRQGFLDAWATASGMVEIAKRNLEEWPDGEREYTHKGTYFVTNALYLRYKQLYGTNHEETKAALEEYLAAHHREEER